MQQINYNLQYAVVPRCHERDNTAMRRTKIVCTLGPASSSPEVLEAMLKNGMNVARLNFSHGTHETHKKMIEQFRAVRDKLRIPAAVLLDTKGPEIRLGEIEGGEASLQTGASFKLFVEPRLGNSEGASYSYANLASDVRVGDRILIDDGKIWLEITEISGSDILCRVTEGGIIKSRKSLNVPNVHLTMPYISPADEKDLLFGIENDVDFVAASFVRSGDDVIALRKFLNYYGGHNIRIISKIENREGVDNIDEILRYSDGIMIARGDMGVEIAYEKLPGIQKSFIRKAYSAGKMVITATQMLESMITSATPTRAEITDVANAVFDGTSAIMLSGETAAGRHPAHVVSVMAKIAEQAEHDAFAMSFFGEAKYETDFSDITNAICDAACTTARDVNARAIIVVTKTGTAARRVSKFRPVQPIVAATPETKTFHQLSLSWGVCPVLALCQNDTDKLFSHAIDCAKQIDVVSDGDFVVITGGVPLNQAGTTNVLKVQNV